MERKTSVDINEQLGCEGLFGVVPGSYGPAICWDMKLSPGEGSGYTVDRCHLTIYQGFELYPHLFLGSHGCRSSNAK